MIARAQSRETSRLTHAGAAHHECLRTGCRVHADKLAALESGYEEGKHGATLDRQQHEESDGINVSLPHAAAKWAGGLARTETPHDHWRRRCPEGKLVQDIRDAQASKAQKL